MEAQEGKKVKVIKEGLFHLPESPEEEPYLIGSRCEKCGRVYFPQRVICADCFTDESMKVIPLSRKGKLYTYCYVMFAQPEFKPPFPVGYVDLPEQVRVYAILTGVKDFTGDALKVGMEMEMVVDTIKTDPDGTEWIGYKFKPTKQV